METAADIDEAFLASQLDKGVPRTDQAGECYLPIFSDDVHASSNFPRNSCR